MEGNDLLVLDKAFPLFNLLLLNVLFVLVSTRAQLTNLIADALMEHGSVEASIQRAETLLIFGLRRYGESTWYVVRARTRSWLSFLCQLAKLLLQVRFRIDHVRVGVL